MPTGPSTRDTLAARSHLAHWTGEAGDAAGARDQFAALLPVFERVLGPEHPDTLTARHNLAHWTGEAGDAAGARDQFAALLPIRERVLGPEHPDTLTARAQPRPLDRGGGGCGRGPRPVRRPAAHPRAGPGPRAPRHPDHPPQPRLLDRGGGGCGRGPRPVRRPAAHLRAGPGPRAPRHPDHPRTTSPTGPGRRGMRLLTRADPGGYRLGGGRPRAAFGRRSARMVGPGQPWPSAAGSSWRAQGRYSSARGGREYSERLNSRTPRTKDPTARRRRHTSGTGRPSTSHTLSVPASIHKSKWVLSSSERETLAQ